MIGSCTGGLDAAIQSCAEADARVAEDTAADTGREEERPFEAAIAANVPAD